MSTENKPKNCAAFPLEIVNQRTAGVPTDWRYQHGMSLRDYFAAKAMQSLIAKNGACHPSDAYEVADAMLKAREQ